MKQTKHGLRQACGVLLSLLMLLTAVVFVPGSGIRAQAATEHKASGTITYTADGGGTATAVSIAGAVGDTILVEYSTDGTWGPHKSLPHGIVSNGTVDYGHVRGSVTFKADNSVNGNLTFSGTIQNTAPAVVDLKLGDTVIGHVYINADQELTKYAPPANVTPASAPGPNDVVISASDTPPANVTPVPAPGPDDAVSSTPDAPQKKTAPAEPGWKRVSVMPAEYSFLASAPEALTFRFETPVDGYAGLESVQVPTETDKATGKRLWIGPAHLTVNGREVTIAESATALLTPGRHRIRFNLGNFRYAEVTVNVLTEENFDAKNYAARYEDLHKAFGDDSQMLWSHYTLCGHFEKRNVRAVN